LFWEPENISLTSQICSVMMIAVIFARHSAAAMKKRAEKADAEKSGKGESARGGSSRRCQRVGMCVVMMTRILSGAVGRVMFPPGVMVRSRS